MDGLDKQVLDRDVEDDAAFGIRFVRTASIVMAVGAAGSGAGLLLVQPDAWRLGVMLGVSAVIALFTWGLSRLGRHRVATKLLPFGLSIAIAVACLWDPASQVARGALVILLLLVVVTAFLDGVRAALALGALNTALTTAVAFLATSRGATDASETVVAALSLPPLIVVTMLIVPHFIRHAARNSARLALRLDEAERVRAQAAAIAHGDLTVILEGDSALATAVRKMLGGLRDLVVRIQGTASHVRGAAEDIGSLSHGHSEGAVQQAVAVAQATRTLATFVGSAASIADAVQEVVRAAQSTQENNEVIGQRVEELNRHAKRIGELLDAIEQIAMKSETLALNAALEGVRAGESGRGFVVVAARMKQLAEEVQGAVATVVSIMGAVAGAGAASSEAARRSTALAAETTRAAREISTRAVQQRQGAEELSLAMADISKVAAEVAAGSSEVTKASEALATLASSLEASVDAFKV
jgi:methyl-accepting chemotaxis protein